ncbi:retrovirus-related pol polyprotein from transposon TNT 1-94, partial [Tanacetum coccineum]
ICLGVDLEPDEWIKDSRCSKHMTGNQKLFSNYKAYNGGNVIFGSNLHGNIIGKVKSTRTVFKNSKAYIILNKHTRKVEESLNVTFDETPPPSKTSPLVDDDLDEEEAIKVTEKKNLENDIKDETLEIDKIVNIKESRNHPSENVGSSKLQPTRGHDYEELHAPVARLESIRILLAYACALDFKLFQIDVKIAFLNGLINEVYVAQSLGFIDFEKPDHVYKLKKALYGLKQAPNAWLFKHVVSVSPELAFDHYLSHDRAMHLLAPHYERKTRADRGKKRPREQNASSSSSTLNHLSSSQPWTDSHDEMK